METLTASDNNVDSSQDIPAAYLQKLLVRHSPHSGRSLHTHHALPTAGTAVYTGQPMVCALDGAAISSRCSACWAALAGASQLRCSQCKQVKYCNRLCQRNHWSQHRLECYLLSFYKLQPTALLPASKPTLMTVIRLILRHVFRPSAIDEQSHHTMLQQYQQLTSNVDQVGAERRAEYQKMSLLVTEVMSKLVKAVELSKNSEQGAAADATALPAALRTEVEAIDLGLLVNTYLSPQWLTEQFSRLACNAFTITDSELKPVSIGLYPTVLSLLNHSCDPNCCVIFDCTDENGAGLANATLRTLRPIAADEELTINYIDLAATTRQRQDELLQQYHFQCMCARCSDTSSQAADADSRKVAWLCAAGGCKGLLVADDMDRNLSTLESDKAGQLRCTRCKKQQPAQPILALHEQAANKQMPVKQRMYILLQRVDTRYNLLLLSTLNEASRAAVSDEDWAAAEVYHIAELRVMLHVYPTAISPVIGLQYYLCAKLLWLRAATERAIDYWQRAEYILGITHGNDHSLVRQIRLSLQEAAWELQQQSDMANERKSALPEAPDGKALSTSTINEQDIIERLMRLTK